MGKKTETLLRNITPDPDPVRKDRFLRAYRRKTAAACTSILSIIKQQFPFISMPVWLITLAALVIAIWGVHTNRNIIFGITLLMPFVSGFAVFETFRSQLYRLAEIESTTLFSLRGIIFAKIICIGSVHLLLLLGLTLMLSPVCPYNFFTTGTIITIPYLFSSAASLKAENSVFGRKYPFACLGISAMTSVLVMIAHEKNLFLTANHPMVRNILFVLLITLLLNEIRKTLNEEEYLWN